MSLFWMCLLKGSISFVAMLEPIFEDWDENLGSDVESEFRKKVHAHDGRIYSLHVASA